MPSSSTQRKVRPPHAPGAEQLVQSLVSEFVEEKRRERQLEQRDRSPVRRLVAPALAAVACLSAWVAPVPKAGGDVQPPSARHTMASARVTLVLAARRLESFRAQYRRLPTTLDDAGIFERSLSYRTAVGETFVLRLPVGGSYLTFDSGTAPATILEDAVSIIRGTTK